MDYEENIKIGGGPIETNQCFYENAPVSILGYALVYKKDEMVIYEYHDFLSEILYHDSFFQVNFLLSFLV